VNRDNSKKAVDLLRENQIFSQGTFIVGHRTDNKESINELKEYADYLNPDLATFFALTPFPGTEIYTEAKRKGWIEDENWTNYDMVHAIMPTEHLTRKEVQQEIFECYRSYFSSWPRIHQAVTSQNPLVRKTYGYLATQTILSELKRLFK
jgi:anaerobic magnesium-protoporphyrin IX monomethyl ester cyclase